MVWPKAEGGKPALTVVSLGMGKFSGPRVTTAEIFTMQSKWAKLPFGVAHNFTATDDALVAACGYRVDSLPTDAAGPIMFEEGNWGRCKRCARQSFNTEWRAGCARRSRQSY